MWTLKLDLSVRESELINFIEDHKASVEPETTKSAVEEKAEGKGGAGGVTSRTQQAQKVSQSEERDRLMKDLDTRIVVQVGSESQSKSPPEDYNVV